MGIASLSGAAAKARRSARVSGPLWTATLIADELLPLGLARLWPDRRVSVDRLDAQLTAVLGSWGMPAEQVETTVRHMLHADRHGIDSHGCRSLLYYRRLLLAGELVADPVIELVREGETTAVVNGGGGLGHAPADLAMTAAIDRARESGLGAIGVRNSGHFGAAGGYALMAAEQALIGIATTSAARPALVPSGGTAPMLGTNPIAFAAPGAHGRPFLLDMSTSTVPMGRIASATRSGGRIPAGWALNARGGAMRNARRALAQRRLTPLGGSSAMGDHKGYGLATMVEILSALLPGVALGAEDRRGRIGHFLLAIDPARFRDDAGFSVDVDRLLDSLRATVPADPARPVRVAGDPEWAAAAERDRLGIPLPRGTIEDIRGVARDSGVPFTLGAAR